MNNLDATSLIKAGRAVPEPFQLAIRDDDGVSVIRIEKILRLLPRRRIVALAEKEGRQILVKVFVGRSSARYAAREVRGVQAIEDAGVQTPFFEWQADLEGGGGKVIAFEYIAGTRNLIDVWEETKSTRRLELIQAVIPELARLHESGVVQNDIHPENFLIRDARIYTIDGGDVTRKRDLGEKQSLTNLALFLAQFQARDDELIEGILSTYEIARGWPSDTARLAYLRRLVRDCRAERKKDYIEKAFRECTRFSCNRSFNRYAVCERKYDSAQLKALMANPDAAIARGEVLKKGNTATIALVEGPAGPLVIKRYNIKGYKHLVSRLFRKSRAWISWANTFRLEFLGISTLKPVALIEERFGPLRGRAYFITEFVEGKDATSLVDQDDPKAVSSIVEILNGMSEAGVSHGDLKASNFLLTDQGAVLLDLDSMKEHNQVAVQARAQAKDRERFMRNWATAPILEKRFADLLQSP